MILSFWLKKNIHLFQNTDLIPPNLAFRYKNRAIVTNRIPKPDLSFMPAISTLKEVENRGGTMRIQASRGCIFHCDFCTVNQVYGIQKRVDFSVKNVLGYIGKVAENTKSNPAKIDFVDDEFVGEPVNFDRLKRIFRGIIAIKRKIKKDIEFSIAANSWNFDIILNPQKRKLKNLWFLAKEAGLKKVFLGLESHVLDQLKRYNKKGSPQTNINALKFLREILGIRVEVAMLLFDYEMDKNWREELRTNFKFLYESDLYKERAIFIRVVRPIKGTALFERYKEKGILGAPLRKYSPISSAYFTRRDIKKFLSVSNKWSPIDDAFHQIRYRLKQDLLFKIDTKEDFIKKELKEKIAELDFIAFSHLLNNLDNNKEIKNIEQELFQERIKILKLILDFIKNKKIIKYKDYYKDLSTTCISAFGRFIKNDY